ncbi:AbrB family transcriptional regulator [Roseomonas sp. BN140053]|uniref:AbrB family transcriptional regulator n=1 Tax=Roseomonas sp. BN140053 TaxID=3391898 RepID=UPI0039EA26A9
MALPASLSFPGRDAFRQQALCYAVAALGGALFFLIHTPLPWMLGALCAVAAAQLAGLPLAASRRARNIAALVLGCALGLNFTPAAAERLLRDVPLCLGAALATILVGLLLMPVLAWLARIDRRTALLSSLPGGAADMALLAEGMGARPAIVAVLQLLRVVGVVVLVPSGLALLGGLHSSRAAGGVGGALHWPGFLLLLALGGVGVFVLTKARLRNAWLLGGLVAALGFTASDISLTGMPSWVTGTAQVLLGAQLGTQFERATFLGGRRLLTVALLHVGLLTAGCALVGLLLAFTGRASPGVLVLATAPGGVAEMSITAQAMALDVPIVVAFHLVRIFLTALLVQPICALFGRWGWI